MAYNGLTPYLGLRLVTLHSDSWYADMTVNFSTIDNIAKNFMVQPRAGMRTGIRAMLKDGTLVDAVTVDPQRDGSLKIILGRIDGSDSVMVAGSFIFTSISIINQNITGFGKLLRIYADYPLNKDTKLTLNTRDSEEIELKTPHGEVGVPFIGSTYQLEYHRQWAGGEVPYCLTFKTTKDGVERTFLVPTYEI